MKNRPNVFAPTTDTASAAQSPAPAKIKNPPKAYENPDFIRSPYGRQVRVLSEMTEPLQRLNRHRIRNTVVFFGSARIAPLDKAREALADAEAAAKAQPNTETAERLEKAQRDVEAAGYYEAARQLAGDVTRWSKTLPKTVSPFYICSGGGPGIMEAANRGASEAGGVTLGLGISLPHEQSINPYVTQGLSFEFHYFFVRKYWLVSLARAVVAFPGGFGTMDELFELLTLAQTRKMPPVPVILYGSKFWNEVVNFKAFVKWAMIDEADLSLFHIVDTPEEARAHLLPALNKYCREHEYTHPADLSHPHHANPPFPQTRLHHPAHEPQNPDAGDASGTSSGGGSGSGGGGSDASGGARNIGSDLANPPATAA
ncbi:MAG: TIGR00730 family Rossman fold protein [Puniceicoccales bacterium]|jgi:uncharacterized protein (TIGR00730 family)|nr:TIGR00730 family Rossman fold protein [Puniceicoccales bacterium]